MIITLNILLLIALAGFGYRTSHKSDIKVYYWPGLALKVIAGIGLGLLYSYYYAGGDSWVMFNEAIRLADTAFYSTRAFSDIYLFSDYSSIPDYAFVLQPRAAFMTKIIALPASLTGDNYWLTSCYFSMFSFFGFWFAANIIYNIVGNKTTAILPALFFPSVVFWSSGILKESIAISSLAVAMTILINAYYKKRTGWLSTLLLVGSIMLLLYLKYYYAAILIVSFITVFVIRVILPKTSTRYIELGSIVIVFFTILGITSLFHPNFWPSRFLTVITDNYYNFIESSSDENVVKFNSLTPTITSFLYYSPKALLAGLFYPLTMESFNFLKMASVLENWLVLFSFIYAVRWFKIPELRDNRLLLWAILLFVITAAVFITFSTPYLGTLARFKIGYWAVFVTLITGVITNRIRQHN